MLPEQLACIGSNQTVAGQVIDCHSFLLAPLHVIDYRTVSSLSLMDRHGNIGQANVSEVLAVDPACDAVIFRTDSSPAAPAALRLVPMEESGCEVEVRAVVPPDASTGHADGLVIHRSRIRDVVEIERHVYRAASGRLAIARNVRAVFLTEPLPAGWSGAPAYISGTSEIAGFVHCNAPANNGAAVCLVPLDGSILLRTMKQHLVGPGNG